MNGTEADSLREWFASQKEFKTWRDLARYLGIDDTILSKYKTGRRPISNPDHRSLLYKGTSIEAFSKPYKPMQESQRREARRGDKTRKLVPDTISPEASDSSSLVINGVRLSTREELSAYLRDWLRGQPLGTTISKLARQTSIPYSTFMNYFSGHGYPGIRNRDEFIAFIERLSPSARVHKVEQPRDASTKVKGRISIEDIEDLSGKLGSLLSRLDDLIPRAEEASAIEVVSPPRSGRDHARKVLSLLFSLDTELRYFRGASESERDVLRKTIRGQDVGYITSLLRAMYDEDKFQSWQLFVSYRMSSGEPGGR